MLELFALIYGLAGSTASLAPYFKKLKKKLFWEATHEKVIFDCCKKAFEDVTGEDLEKFQFKGTVAILEKVDQYLTSGDMQGASNITADFFHKSKIDVKQLQKRFEFHLIEADSLEVFTHINLVTLKDIKEIKETVYRIYENLGKIAPPKEAPILTGIPAPPAPYFAHPYPMQKNFTGRIAERKELTEWFTKRPESMFAYIAIGGIGKSALIWYWLHEDIIKQGLAPEGIIWWSFYDKEATFETFLVKAIQYVSEGKIDPKTIDSTRDRMECLYNLFCNNRLLLILDGVERVLRAYAGLGSPYQGDEVKEDEKEDFRRCVDPNVGTFLQWLISAESKTKTLLTSRLCPKELDGLGGCVQKKLTKINKEDAVEFIRHQGIKGTRAEIETACDAFGYHPLSLRLLSGMIAEDPEYPNDIKNWIEYNPLPELVGIKQEYKILELAYDSLDHLKKTLISRLSAFRNPMDYYSISVFNQFGNEKEFNESLIELQDRGLLLLDGKTNRYDIHPIVKSFCYDKLVDKKGVHSQLRDYFTILPEPEKVESLGDLAPLIELYYHTVNSGKYDEAWKLLYDRLCELLFMQFGAYQTEIELLRSLFPEGEENLPRLKNEERQAWVMNEIALCYSLVGQPQKALSFFKRQIAIREKQDMKKGVAIGLLNLAYQQIAIGELQAAESSLQRMISLCYKINDKESEAMGHRELGRLLAYQGEFEESEKQLVQSTKYWEETNHKEGLCIAIFYIAIRALLMSDANFALKAAKKARELADVKKEERNIIRAEWVLGAAYIATGDFAEAEKHLDKALRRDRKINLVDLEPDILLELAKLLFKQSRREETLKLANEALQIADRCEYRLKQADIHNFLAEFYLDAKDYNIAKKHTDIARERAGCGYKPALEKALSLLHS